MKTKETQGGFGVYSETTGLVAVMEARDDALCIVADWARAQDAAQRHYTRSLRILGVPPHGLGAETSVNEHLVLRLGGRLV